MMIIAQLQLDLEVFRGGGGGAGAWRLLTDPRLWAIVITILGSAAAVLAIADIVRRDRQCGGPTARLLARSLGLDRGDLRLLARLARKSDFPSPACLMISRGCFEHATKRYGPSDHDTEIDRLREQLFVGTSTVQQAHE